MYCNNSCQHAHEWAKRRQKIEATGMGTGAPVKRYVRERDGNRCSICLLSEWFSKPMPVVLDHIDGNSDNWNITNLRLICPNCDTFTPTYKGRNRGKGRFARRQRYLAGLSY